MIKLFVTDIDNTLTEQAFTVPQPNLDAIARAKSAGVYVTVATGRGYLGASTILDAIKPNCPVICYGGAVIADADTAEPVFVSEIGNELVQEALSLADEMGIHAHIYQGDTIVSETDDFYTHRYVERLHLPVRIDPMLRKKVWHAVPKVLWITSEEEAVRVIPMLRERFAGRLKISGSSPGFVEFNTLGVDKGTGVARLAAHLGVAREEVAAAGDNTLDLEMIEWAGLGAAVSDGKASVKEIADVITPACADCGVAWLIDEYILKGR